MILEFKIYDMHFDMSWQAEENDFFLQPHDGLEWLPFNFAFNPDIIKIDCFRSFVLFNGEDPIQCTKVFLSDGSALYACMNYIQFRNFYNKQYLKDETNIE